MVEALPFKYRAFLSYSHRDTAWCKWLHAALEGYRVDKDLIGRETSAGPVPKTLRPIFRDREDFSAGHSLTEQTLAALEASQFLIVLCSPNAARSPYVSEEIRRFKALGRADRVIPVIVDGEPGDPARECFPPALRFKLDPEGALTEEREEPIAADARPQGDGKEIAKQKVVAGLLGVGLDEIMRRAERARKRHARLRNGVVGVLITLTVVSASGLVWARYELGRNEALLDRTLQRATGLVDRAVAMSENFGVPRTVSVGLLEDAEGLFRDMSELGRETSQLRYRKAWMLIQFARNYAVLGRTEARRDRAEAAHRLMEGLAAENADNTVFQHDLAVSYGELADVLVDEGNLGEALVAHRAAFAIYERLALADPNDTDRQRNLGLANQYVGHILFMQGDLKGANKAYRAAYDINNSDLLRTNLGNIAWLSDAWSLAIDMSAVYEAQYSRAGLLNSQRWALARAQELVAAQPDVARWKDYVATSHEKIGEVLIAQGDFAEALADYTAAIPIRDGLVKSEPDNVLWQRKLASAYYRVARARESLGELNEAAKNYRANLDIIERLAKADPKNASLEANLAVSSDAIGTVLLKQSNLDAALGIFRNSLAIHERLTKADPKNGNWRYGLSTWHASMGEIRLAQADLDQALGSFRSALTLRQRLADADPSNVEWRRGLVAMYRSIGDVLMKQGKLDEALSSYRGSIDALKHDLAIGSYLQDEDISKLLKGTIESLMADQDEARRADNEKKINVLRAMAGSLVSVAKNSPWDEVNQFRDLSIAYDEIGRVLVVQGRFDEAIKSFRAGADTLVRTVAGAPGNKSLRADLAAARNTLCWRLALLDRLGEALVECNESLQLNSEEANAIDSRGFVYLKMGELDKAIADYDAALALNPKLATALYGRGLAKRRSGDGAGGDADIKVAQLVDAGIVADFERYGLR